MELIDLLALVVAIRLTRCDEKVFHLERLNELFKIHLFYVYKY